MEGSKKELKGINGEKCKKEERKEERMYEIKKLIQLLINLQRCY
jgi:hypothetical protein